MASGTINLNNSAQTSGGGYLMGKVEWSSTGNIASNQSTTTAKLYVKKAATSGTITIPTNGHWACSLTVGGSNVSQSVSASIGADWVLMLTLTIPVTHNSDGTKSISISASAYGPSGTSYSGLQTVGSGTAVLDSIPRASTASFGSFTMDTEGTITIKRASSSFTHTLTYKFGSASGPIASKTTATSVSWTPPLTLANQIPNATSGSGTITLTTYSGSTKIGSKIYNVTLSVPSSVAPSISAVSISEAVSGLADKFGAYVQNKSKLAVSITAAGAYGSTIQRYATTIQGRSYSGRSFTSGILTASGTIKLTVKVTDSRGRTATKTDVMVNVAAYSPPEITAMSAYRIGTSGNADDAGERLALRLAYSVASVGGKNDRTLTIRYQQGNTGTLTTITSATAETSYNGTMTYTGAPVISPDYSYTVRVTLQDYFTSVSYSTTVPTSQSVIDILASGNGIAFGKAAESSGLMDVAWSARIRRDLFVDGTLTSESIGSFTGNINGISNSDSTMLPSRSVICWCSTKNVSGTLPISDGYFILESKKIGGSTLIMLQRAVTFSSSGNYGVYTRMYVNEQWYPWMSQADRIYPVGSIYMSASSADPGTLFGGTWVRIQDRFLLAAGDTYQVGATGGEATHQLSIDELAKHDHGIANAKLLTTDNSKAVQETSAASGVQNVIGFKTATAAGGGKAHNNMPPYLAVYMWKRTA